MKITSFDKVERSGGYVRARVTIKGVFRDTQRGVYAPRGSSLWYFFDDGQMAPSEVRQAYEAWVARDAFENPTSEHIADAEKAAKKLAADQAAAAAAFFGIYPGSFSQKTTTNDLAKSAQVRQNSSSGGDMLTGALLGGAAGYAWSSGVSEPSPQSTSAPEEVSSGGGGDFGGGGASGEY